MAQAKLKTASGDWRELTDTQESLLPGRLDYSALLLYAYVDENRRKLGPFGWQSCRAAKNIEEVVQWLKEESFPSVLDSGQVIRALAKGDVGTGEPKTIDDVIAPPENTWIEVNIDWPGGSGARSHVYVHSRAEAEQKVHVRVSR